MGELGTRRDGANLHIAIHLVGLARAADVGLQVHGLSWHSFPRFHCTRSHAHEWPRTSDVVRRPAIVVVVVVGIVIVAIFVAVVVMAGGS